MLICYDPASAIMWEAALCGCPTILVSDTAKNHAKTLIGMDGACSGIEDIQQAIETMPNVREKIMQIEAESKKQLEYFLF